MWAGLREGSEAGARAESEAGAESGAGTRTVAGTGTGTRDRAVIWVGRTQKQELEHEKK